MFLPFLAAFSQFLSYSNSVETDYEIEYSSSFVGIGKFHFPTEQILIRMFFITQYGIEFVSFFAGEAFHEHLPVFQQLLHHPYQTYGRNPNCTLWTNQVALMEQSSVKAILPIYYRNLGSHESENVLAAWIVCKQFGIDISNLKDVLNKRCCLLML